MKKKSTLVALLRAQRLAELSGSDLELAMGGIKTITQDANGKVIVVEGDVPPV